LTLLHQNRETDEKAPTPHRSGLSLQVPPPRGAGHSRDDQSGGESSNISNHLSPPDAKCKNSSRCVQKIFPLNAFAIYIFSTRFATKLSLELSHQVFRRLAPTSGGSGSRAAAAVPHATLAPANAPPARAPAPAAPIAQEEEEEDYPVEEQYEEEYEIPPIVERPAARHTPAPATHRHLRTTKAEGVRGADGRMVQL